MGLQSNIGVLATILDVATLKYRAAAFADFYVPSSKQDVQQQVVKAAVQYGYGAGNPYGFSWSTMRDPVEHSFCFLIAS